MSTERTTSTTCSEHDSPQVIGILTGLPLCYCEARQADPTLPGCNFPVVGSVNTR